MAPSPAAPDDARCAADPRPLETIWMKRRIDMPLGDGRHVALRRGVTAEGAEVYVIDAAHAGRASQAIFSAEAMAAICAAFAALAAEPEAARG